MACTFCGDTLYMAVESISVLWAVHVVNRVHPTRPHALSRHPVNTQSRGAATFPLPLSMDLVHDNVKGNVRWKVGLVTKVSRSLTNGRLFFYMGYIDLCVDMWYLISISGNDSGNITVPVNNIPRFFSLYILPFFVVCKKLLKEYILGYIRKLKVHTEILRWRNSLAVIEKII